MIDCGNGKTKMMMLVINTNTNTNSITNTNTHTDTNTNYNDNNVTRLLCLLCLGLTIGSLWVSLQRQIIKNPNLLIRLISWSLANLVKWTLYLSFNSICRTRDYSEWDLEVKRTVYWDGCPGPVDAWQLCPCPAESASLLLVSWKLNWITTGNYWIMGKLLGKG